MRIMVTAITAAILLFSAIIAADAKTLPCWVVKSAISIAGSEEAAIRIALQQGYTQAEIERARRVCLKK